MYGEIFYFIVLFLKNAIWDDFDPPSHGCIELSFKFNSVIKTFKQIM